MNVGKVSSLGDKEPFKFAWQSYRKVRVGLAQFPLKPEDKRPDVSGFHGKTAKYPTDVQAQKWANDKSKAKNNIGLRLAGISPARAKQKFEVIGIDVDHYSKGGKDYRGYDELLELQDELGPLPETWISSARTDGKSGIRFFQVPAGLNFRGKARGSKSNIDIISKGNRYAAVWPSMHDDLDSQYWWYPPSIQPIKRIEIAGINKVPSVFDLPLLPPKWLSYLTQEYTKFSVDPMDMDRNPDELREWMDENFNDGTNLCLRMEKTLQQQKQKILEESTSHDKLTDFHWHIFNLAFEGHEGWKDTVKELEVYWVEDVLGAHEKLDKRGMDQAAKEIFRSWTGAIRKIIIQAKQRVDMGAVPVPTDLCGFIPPELGDILIGAAKDPNEYEMNHDGNAQHFYDLFSTIEIGPIFRWIEGFGWIVWKSGENPHWQRDPDGWIMRRMWRAVKHRQLEYVERLKTEMLRLAQVASTSGQGMNNAGTGAAVGSDWHKAIGLYKKWFDFYGKFW